jgi:hypothetical protein
MQSRQTDNPVGRQWVGWECNTRQDKTVQYSIGRQGGPVVLEEKRGGEDGSRRSRKAVPPSKRCHAAYPRSLSFDWDASPPSHYASWQGCPVAVAPSSKHHISGELELVKA